jgi:hypothetical protein
MRRSCVVAVVSMAGLVAGVGCGHSARQASVLSNRDVDTIGGPGAGFHSGTSTVVIPASGLTVRQGLEGFLFVHDIAHLGRTTRARCARNGRVWTCTIHGTHGRLAVCTVAVADDKLEGAYCNRRR